MHYIVDTPTTRLEVCESLSVRPAIAADALVLARFRYEFRAAIAPPSEDETTFVARCLAWVSHRLGADRSWRAWVAESRAVVVGTVWLQLIEKMPNPSDEPEMHGYITNLFVRDHARGEGLGNALLAAALEECEIRHVDAVILWPTPRSRSLYERHGFAVGDDLMERRLPDSSQKQTRVAR